MAITSAPPDRSVPPERLVREFKLWVPGPIKRLPEWVRVGGFLLILCLGSLFVRTHEIGQQFWMDEAIATGIASHSLSAIPGILRMDGSPPLYYMLLHIWISWFGNTEAATHWMSLLFGTLTIPVSYWVGRSVFNKRTGMMAAVLFAFSAFITQYSQETRMYSLMALLGLFATAGFLHGFVYRRRRYVILFAVSLALMLYTHAWALFFGAGSVIALVILYYMGDEKSRENLVKDAVFAYLGAGILFLPWLPNFFYQMTHTAAPWDSSPRLGAPVQLSRNLVGGDAVTAALVFGACIGLSDLVVKKGRGTALARSMWMMVALATLTLALAWLASQITPAWVPRYFAPIVAPILLLGALGLARAGIVGAVALVLALIFLHSPTANAPSYKSDMQDVAAEIGLHMNRGDVVIVAQPEQTPLANYYFPGGLRFASTIGPVKDPTYMNWVHALNRLTAANPSKVLPPILKSLKPGQQVAFIRPMTEGANSWGAPWTRMVRRRAAQWGAIIAADKQLRAEYTAPANYNGACCVADAAILYKRVST